MKSVWKKCLAMLAPIFLVLFGCAALQQLVQKPTVSFDKADLTAMSFTEGTILFRFNVLNPNPIGLTVRKATYSLKLNQKDFVQGVLEKGIVIQANGTAPLEFPLTIRYMEFVQSMQELFELDQVPYDLSGALSVGPFEIPYSTKGILPVPKLPDIALKQIKVSQLSLSGAKLLFTMRMTNRNAFSISPAGLVYKIGLSGVRFAEGEMARVQTVPENGESVFELPLNVSFLQLGKSAHALLGKSASAYEISGSVKLDLPSLGVQSFGFQKTGNVSILK